MNRRQFLLGSSALVAVPAVPSVAAGAIVREPLVEVLERVSPPDVPMSGFTRIFYDAVAQQLKMERLPIDVVLRVNEDMRASLREG